MGFFSKTATEAMSWNIGIKHGFPCINIRQVPWEVLKTEAARSGAGQYTSASAGQYRAAILWPRYEHIESCVAVH